MIVGTHGDKVKLEDQCLLFNVYFCMSLNHRAKEEHSMTSYLTDLSSITQKLDEGNMKILVTIPFTSK